MLNTVCTSYSQDTFLVRFFCYINVGETQVLCVFPGKMFICSFAVTMQRAQTLVVTPSVSKDIALYHEYSLGKMYYLHDVHAVV